VGVYFDEAKTLPAQVSALVQVASERRRLALAVVPRVRSPEELGQLIAAIDGSPGWRVTVEPCSDDAQYTLVDMRWLLDGELTASAIGFAPLGSMAPTRRAPYTALAVWPCGYDNPHRKKPADFVGVGDMNLGLDEKTYRAHHRTTRQNVDAVRELLREPGVRTGITYRLPAAALRQLG